MTEMIVILMLAVIRYGSNNNKAYFRFALRCNWNNIMSYLLINMKLFFLHVCTSIKFISIIPTLPSQYAFNTHSLPIQLTFTKDKNILSLLYGAFAEILRSNITAY